MGAPSNPRAGALAEGDAAPGFTFGPVTRTHIVRYAGASADFTPIHHDEVLATSVGLPAVFAMGMMHGGMLAHLAADWLGLAAVRSLRIRFEDRVWPGDVLSFAGTITRVWEEDDRHRVRAELTCTNQNGRRNLTGHVEAELPR